MVYHIWQYMWLINILLQLLFNTTSCQNYNPRVLELSDRFLELKHNGFWLIELYAPWCTHCRKLEPIYDQVAQSFYNSSVKVGRIDGTRFSIVASELQVKGYPTIMFFKNGKSFIYYGERTRKDIVAFATRLSGNPIQSLSKEEMMLLASDQSVFIYSGKRNGCLWKAFEVNAEMFYEFNFFYVIDWIPRQIKNLVINTNDFIFSYENGMYTIFSEHSERNISIALGKWIENERFGLMPRVSNCIFQNLLKMEKYLVLTVLQENFLGDLSHKMLREHKDDFHPYFQFGWFPSPFLANSIAMQYLLIPSLIVVHPPSNTHYIPEDDPEQLTEKALVIFLNQILNGSVHIWKGNPIMTIIVLGLPLFFLSLICYSTCCPDILDDENESQKNHSKRD